MKIAPSTKELIFRTLELVSLPVSIIESGRTDKIILFKGLKATKRYGKNGNVSYTIEDTSAERYTRIENNFILNSILAAIETELTKIESAAGSSCCMEAQRG